MKHKVEYPPCKECGKSHGMGIENMETGEIKPIDLCHDCLWSGMEITQTEWGGSVRCMTSDARNVNMADELNRLQKMIIENS